MDLYRLLEMDEDGLNPSGVSPDAIRTLRGGMSRAQFASRVGVTAQTVYRWELAPGSAESRRPRGVELARLKELLRTGVSSAVGAPSMARTVLRHPVYEFTQDSDDAGPALGALLRSLAGEWQRGERELLALASKSDVPRETRLMAQTGLGVLEALLHCDGQHAMATLSSPLAEIDSVGPRIRAWIHAAAAICHAQLDGRLLDLGRAHAHASAIRRDHDPEAWVVGWLGGLYAAFICTDIDLVRQAFARLGHDSLPGLPPLLLLHIDEGRALEALVTGQPALASERFRDVARRAHEFGHNSIEARAQAFYATRCLDDLAAPDDVLALARQSRETARVGRVRPGVHSIFAFRAELESLLRGGRLQEIPAVIEEISALAADTEVEPTAALLAVARYLSLTGSHARMYELADRLKNCHVVSLRSLCLAQESFIRALALLSSSADPDETVRAWERTEREAATWPFILRDSLVHGSVARVVAGQPEAAARSLRQLARVLDAAPSPWIAAHQRRAEGTYRAAIGDWVQARELLAAAVATFELAGDKVDAALTRMILMTFGAYYGEPDAEEQREQAESTALALGIVVPAGLQVGLARLRRELRASSAIPSKGILDRLVVAVRRLTVRGTSPHLIERELVQVVRELLPGRGVRLEDVDSRGVSTLLGATSNQDVAAPKAVSHDSDATLSIEFGDGSGRRLRLVIRGVIDSEERQSLALVIDAVGLALEVATLRGLGGQGRALDTSGAEAQDIPGFVAVSASIRRLRAEIAGLGHSRATVVVVGESGSGKEVVARAIHDLSTRRARPYVPFNCATVPRDLFEGQLFGYKKGAFTGAFSDHPGVIRAAEGGTLFLDEIGELPLDVQPKLLRFLENGEIFPLGARRAVKVDVRVIAATHRDLGDLVRRGQFREDLYYRLQVVPLRVPALRERPDDIVPLARHFVRLLAPEGEVPVLSPDALSLLQSHSWPGNVRELRNVIERALAFSPLPEVLRAEHLRIDPALTTT